MKHADPVLDTSLVGSDSRSDLGPADIGHVTVVDVLGAAPAGFTADQALPTGLDGKPTESARNHYGVNDSLLAGHVGSSSPATEMATGFRQLLGLDLPNDLAVPDHVDLPTTASDPIRASRLVDRRALGRLAGTPANR